MGPFFYFLESGVSSKVFEVVFTNLSFYLNYGPFEICNHFCPIVEFLLKYTKSSLFALFERNVILYEQISSCLLPFLDKSSPRFECLKHEIWAMIILDDRLDFWAILMPNYSFFKTAAFPDGVRSSLQKFQCISLFQSFSPKRNVEFQNNFFDLQIDLDLTLFFDFSVFWVILKLLDNFDYKFTIMLIFENGMKPLFLLSFLMENLEIGPDPFSQPVAVEVPCISWSRVFGNSIQFIGF